MDEAEVKLIIKDNKWGIKFLIKGQMVDFADILEKAEKYDAINWKAMDELFDEGKETKQKLEAIKSWWDVFSQTIDSPDAMDRLAEVLGVEG